MPKKHRLTDHQNASKDVWLMFQRRLDTRTDEEWIDFLREVDQVAKKYKGTSAEGYAERYAYLMFCEVGEIAKM